MTDRRAREAEAARHRGRRLERLAAAIILALPLPFLLTYPSHTPWLFGRYSEKVVAAIGVYSTGYVAFLWSYRWELPRRVSGLRTRLVLLCATSLVTVLVLEVLLVAFDPMPYTDLDDVGRHKHDPTSDTSTSRITRNSCRSASGARSGTRIAKACGQIGTTAQSRRGSTAYSSLAIRSRWAIKSP